MPVSWMAGVLRAALHNGLSPMARTMDGRKTPSLDYVPSPKHLSRSELMEERKRNRRAHATFDLDNDGSVDPIEMLVSSLLDVNKDGSLSEAEKKHALALIEKMSKHYVMGLDVRGARWVTICDVQPLRVSWVVFSSRTPFVAASHHVVSIAPLWWRHHLPSCLPTRRMVPARTASASTSATAR